MGIVPVFPVVIAFELEHVDLMLPRLGKTSETGKLLLGAH